MRIRRVRAAPGAILSDLVERIRRWLLTLRVERATQQATVLVLRQRTRRMEAVLAAAESAGVAA